MAIGLGVTFKTACLSQRLDIALELEFFESEHMTRAAFDACSFGADTLHVS